MKSSSLRQESQLDEYLTYQNQGNAQDTIPIVAEAKQAGREIAWSTPAGARYRLSNLSDAELLKEKRTRSGLYGVALARRLSGNVRLEAIRDLAAFEKANELNVLMSTINGSMAKRAWNRR